MIKKITIFLLLALLMSDASAQVSVRRRSSSSQKTEKTEKPKKGKPEGAEVLERPSKPVSEVKEVPPMKKVDPSDRLPQHDATPQRTVPAKRTTPKKTGTQPSEMAEGMTLRQQAFAEYQRQEPQYVPWQHVVYRELDMNVGDNASLYYPIEPMDGMTNLFRVIMDGLCTGQLKAYEYLDGREMFTEKYQINIETMLQRFEIPYQTQSAGAGQTIYRVEEVDVPSNEVMSYYLKERWQYDLTGSRYQAQVLALCPVLHRMGEFGGEAVPYPMCWINFEDLRPLLRAHMVMLDGMNNAPRLTMEEYFTLNKYKGELYKVQNTRGLNLMQQYPDPDSLAVARSRIEAELRGFKDSLWVHEPTAAELAAQDSIAAAERAAKKAARKGKSKTSRDGDSAERVNRRTKKTVDMEAVADSLLKEDEKLEERVNKTGKAHSARRTR